ERANPRSKRLLTVAHLRCPRTPRSPRPCEGAPCGNRFGAAPLFVATAAVVTAPELVLDLTLDSLFDEPSNAQSHKLRAHLALLDAVGQQRLDPLARLLRCRTLSPTGCPPCRDRANDRASGFLRFPLRGDVRP